MAKKKQRLPWEGFSAKPYDTKESRELLARFTEEQRDYYDSLRNNLVTICDANAGTGKTTVAVKAAFDALDAGEISSVIYLRFVTERTLKQGFLPGDIEDKESALFIAFYDAASSLGYNAQSLQRDMEEQRVALTTEINFRGINLQNCALIIDEAQNATLDDLRLVLTRVDDKSRVALIGHSGQLDSKVKTVNGLLPFQVYSMHLTKQAWAEQHWLTVNHRGCLSNHSDAVQDTVDELVEGKVCK